MVREKFVVREKEKNSFSNKQKQKSKREKEGETNCEWAKEMKTAFGGERQWMEVDDNEKHLED